jgi:hypothetical protein
MRARQEPRFAGEPEQGLCALSIDRPTEALLVLRFSGVWRIGEALPSPDAIRRRGGKTARWLPEARQAAVAVFHQLAQEHSDEPIWRWLAGRFDLHYLRS